MQDTGVSPGRGLCEAVDARGWADEPAVGPLVERWKSNRISGGKLPKVTDVLLFRSPQMQGRGGGFWPARG